MSVLIEITIFDEVTDEVISKILRTYDGSYGYEVERTFEQLGEKVAKIIDPQHDRV